jgi:hypothetical protein
MNKSVAEAITHYEQLYLDTLNKIEVCTKERRKWVDERNKMVEEWVKNHRDDVFGRKWYETDEGKAHSLKDVGTPHRYFRRKSLAQASLKGLKMFVNPQWTDADMAKYMKQLRKK